MYCLLSIIVSNVLESQIESAINACKAISTTIFYVIQLVICFIFKLIQAFINYIQG